MTIEDKPCPRCNIRRTARLGSWGSICLNCRRPLTVAASTAEPVAPPASDIFKLAELARLESYRAAILAGLYTDWPAEAELV